MSQKDIISTSVSGSITDKGYSIKRNFFVDNLTGSPEAKIANALDHASVPNIGDTHPVKSGIVVTNISADMTDPTQAKVIVTYGIPNSSNDPLLYSTGVVSFSSTNVTETSHRDVNGNNMFVSFKGFQDYRIAGTDSTYASRYVEIRGIKNVDLIKPRSTVTIKKIFPITPKDYAPTVTGSMNQSPWSGYPAKTWLCTGIASQPNSSGGHAVTFTFQYDPNGWDYEANVFPFGDVPQDAKIGNGLEIFQVYPTYNFNALGVNF